MELLPIEIRKALWFRIAAWVSQRRKREDYHMILNGWFGFLGAKPGTPRAAKLFLSATDLQAIAYVEGLKHKSGEAPRLRRPDNEHAPMVIRKSLGKANYYTLSNTTVRKHIYILRALYKHIIDHRMLSTNPFAVIVLPVDDVGTKRPTEAIRREDVHRLLKTPNIKTQVGLRDKAIMTLMFAGGLRGIEVRNLRLSDLQRTGNGTWYVRLERTKNGKTYHHALPEWALRSIEDWREARLSRGAHPLDWFFCGVTIKGGIHRDERLSSKTLYRRFCRYSLKAGLGAWVTPHSARATAITALLEAGIPPDIVLDFSRHVDARTLKLYDKRRRSVDTAPQLKLTYPGLEVKKDS